MTAVRLARAAQARAVRPGPQDADRHIGTRVRARRVMLGLTQQQVAELVGITYQQAHKYETGINRISAGRLHALARALGVEPGYFYRGAGLGRADPADGPAAADDRAGAQLRRAAPAAAGGALRAGPRARGRGGGYSLERIARPSADLRRVGVGIVLTRTGGDRCRVPTPRPARAALAACEAGEGSQSEVARRYRIGERTLSGWLKLAREEGRRSPSRAAVAGHRGGEPEALAGLVAERNDATLAEYADRLAERTGVRRSPSALCRALKALGLCRRKTPGRERERTKTWPRSGRHGAPSWPGSTPSVWPSSTRAGSTPG